MEQVYQAISFWSDLYFIHIEHLCIIYIYIEYFGPGALHNKPKSSYLHHCATVGITRLCWCAVFGFMQYSKVPALCLICIKAQVLWFVQM